MLSETDSRQLPLPFPLQSEIICDIVAVKQGEVILMTEDGHRILCSMNGVQSGAFSLARSYGQHARVRLEILTQENNNVWKAGLDSVEFFSPGRKT